MQTRSEIDTACPSCGVALHIVTTDDVTLYVTLDTITADNGGPTNTPGEVAQSTVTNQQTLR